MMQIVYNTILLTICLFHKDASTKYVGDRCSPVGKKMDGVCKVVKDCEAAISSLKKIHEHPFSNCGFDGFIEIVCCPTQTTDTQTTEASQTLNKYGPNQSSRIAERECEKIKTSNIPPIQLHIIGGQDAKRGEFPHMVALGYKNSGLETYRFDCGGSLVSETFVISAAHCIYNIYRTKPSIVRAGVVDISGEDFDKKTDIRIKDIIQHPERNASQKYHDIVLLRLERPIEASLNLKPLCLYTSEESPTIPLTVTGWGTISPTENVRSSVLLKANVSVVPKSLCEKTYQDSFRLPRSIINQQICAGDPNGLRDTCSGDSGGPLQGLTSMDGYYRLVGITSFGEGCATSKPAVYTRVASYLDWIESVVWPDS